MTLNLDPSLVSTQALLCELSELVASDDMALYSQNGLQILSKLWTKVAAHERLMYEVTWLGRPIIQLPSDVLVLQEIIWETQPDVIIETGVAHGGSLVLAASILEMVGKGKVIGIDVEVRPHNRTAILEHPLAHRIELVEGDSVGEDTLKAIHEMVPEGSRVMVALDSNHSGQHVARELAAYGELVTPGCYLVVHDGAQLWVWDLPRAEPHWVHDHPLNAIAPFLANNPGFTVDERRTRFGISSSPFGYLLKSELA